MIVKVFTFFVFLTTSLMAYGAVDLKKEYAEFKTATEQRIQKIDRKLDTVGQKLSTMSGEAKESMKKQYDNLVEMKDSLKDKLADAKDATEEKWAQTKDRIEDFADDLESRVDKAFN